MELTNRERVSYAILLVITLLLELSGNQWLSAVARIVKTTAVVVYIMQNGEPGAHNPSFYCCFALLWTLVILVVVAVVYLINDREREHIDLRVHSNQSQFNSST